MTSSGVGDVYVLAGLVVGYVLAGSAVSDEYPNWAGLPDRAVDDLVRKSLNWGVPVAWVPSSATLGELRRVGNVAEAQAVLLGRRDEVLADCDRLVGECEDPWLDESVRLARESLEVLREGRTAAAMALAVVVADQLARWATEPRVKLFESQDDKDRWDEERKNDRHSYRAAGRELLEKFNGRAYRALIAPIPKFYTDWRPGNPLPESVSRHAVAHHAVATSAHFTPGNALVAMMLVVSILRSQQEWSDEVRHDDRI